MNLSEAFWDDRYKNRDTGWDLGEVSPPIKAYIDQLLDRDIRILIPGGGNAYEAEYLHSKGFKNVYVVDISKTALSNIKKRVPTFPSPHLIHKNFFELEMTFDLMIEQTFFCAINPELREQYVSKSYQILSTKGKVVGLLFDAPLNSDKPPFGGCKQDYVEHFKNQFNILLMEDSHNSHKSRLGKELFFIIQKKN